MAHLPTQDAAIRNWRYDDAQFEVHVQTAISESEADERTSELFVAGSRSAPDPNCQV